MPVKAVRAAMKANNFQRLLFISLYSTLVVATLGTMAGTFAWFTYTSRMSNKFHGTSLSNSGNLKVGVVCDHDFPDAADYGFIQDENHGKIYWSEKGINAESLSYFLSACGYASDKLTPVTSGPYETNGEFNLKKRPSFLANPHSDADMKHYIYLPLVFKAETNKGERYNSFDIKLADVTLTDLEEGTLASTIRINFHNEYYHENFLLNPNVIEEGYDVVGGALDFDLDGYNDFQAGHDFLYGYVDNLTYNDTASQGGDPLPRDERTVFNGKTQKGVYGINEDETIFLTSHYLGKEEVISKMNVATANGDDIAFAGVTIYEEGWSRSAVDKITDNAFDLDLKFELFNEKNI